MSESPKPSKIDIVKDAAKRAVALTEIAGVAITGVATMDALATPASASAAPEAARTHEAQTPQAFIKGFDIKFKDLVIKKMRSSRHFDTLGSAAASKAYREAWHKNIVLEHVGVPSKGDPGHYDWLAVALDGDTGHTLWASINLGANSNTYAGMSTSGVYKEGFGFFQTDGKGGFLPNAMYVSKDPGSIDQSQWFGVSTGAYNYKVRKPIMKYRGHEAEVSNNFNTFLTTAERIVDQK